MTARSCRTGTEMDRLTRLGVTAQDAKDGTVSYARMLNKEDFMIDWKRSALSFHRQVMALIRMPTPVGRENG